MLSRFLLPLLVFLAALMSSATAIAAPADQAEPSELRALLSAGQDTNPDFDASGPTPQRSAVIDEPVAQVQHETPQSFDYSANLKSAVFGANLFTGAFHRQVAIKFNPDYMISIGDNIKVRLGGAFQLKTSMPVTPQGNLI